MLLVVSQVARPVHANARLIHSHSLRRACVRDEAVTTKPEARKTRLLTGKPTQLRVTGHVPTDRQTHVLYVVPDGCGPVILFRALFSDLLSEEESGVPCRA